LGGGVHTEYENQLKKIKEETPYKMYVNKVRGILENMLTSDAYRSETNHNHFPYDCA